MIMTQICFTIFVNIGIHKFPSSGSIRVRSYRYRSGLSQLEHKVSLSFSFNGEVQLFGH